MTSLTIGSHIIRTKTRALSPKTPPKRGPSKVGKTTRTGGREVGGEKEGRKAVSAFYGRWVKVGIAGQGAPSEPEPEKGGKEQEDNKDTGQRREGETEGLVGGGVKTGERIEMSIRDRRTDKQQIEKKLRERGLDLCPWGEQHQI